MGMPHSSRPRPTPGASDPAAHGGIQATTVLHIGAQHTSLVAAHGNRAPIAATLPIGAAALADAHFKHAPPTPAELETAIAAIEDAIQHAWPPGRPTPCVLSSDPGVREIARAAGVSGGSEATLSRDAVERTFERFVSFVLRRQIPPQDLPQDSRFAATLMILRELMHHLHVDAITVRDS